MLSMPAMIAGGTGTSGCGVWEFHGSHAVPLASRMAAGNGGDDRGMNTSPDAGTVSAGQPQAIDRRRVPLIIGALLLGMLLAALDQTIVATALPTIAGDLHGLSHLSWVVTAYLLASTVSTPLWGKLGDLYGRKKLFQAAIVIFLVGSALSGLSRRYDLVQISL